MNNTTTLVMPYRKSISGCLVLELIGNRGWFAGPARDAAQPG
mgnify:FL=1